MQNNHIAFFSTRPYEQVVFSQLLENHNSANNQSIKGTFFEHPLNPSTAISCKGYSDVVVFVNDDVNAATIKVLKDCGVKHIALRCAGYNNVDVSAALKLT